MGLWQTIRKIALNFIVVCFLIAILPGMPPRTSFPYRAFDVTPTKELNGTLGPNLDLNNAEHWLEGRIWGPETIIARNNELFAGVNGGEVIKISEGEITHVVKIGKPCEKPHEEARCGRPLGLAFDTIGNNLIIADAYYGIWEFNLDTEEKTMLVSPKDVLPSPPNCRRSKIFNGVAVDQKGDIYWTDSSSDFQFLDLVFAAFANPSGRLFKYDRSKKRNTVLMDGLFFANGLVLSPNEDFIVVAETGAMRLMKYHLKGEKAGQSEVFVDGLPGLPDNVTPDADGIWVALVMTADDKNPSGFNMLSNYPNVRRFLARVMTLIEMPFRLMNKLYPTEIAHRILHFIGHGESILVMAPQRSTIVRVDWNGIIVDSLHGMDGSVGSISHVLEFNGQLLLGSPYNNFLTRVKLPEVYEQTKLSSGKPINSASKKHASTTTFITSTVTTTTKTTTTTKLLPSKKPTLTDDEIIFDTEISESDEDKTIHQKDEHIEL